MKKQDIIINTSIVLNRGIADLNDTLYFKNKKHDELLSEFQKYVENHKSYIGDIKIEISQALNDHGVDILMIVNDNTRIGFQIKSHFDVSEKDFLANVKRQMTESFYHKLDKWYLIICCPLIKIKGMDYNQKISYLVNEFSSYNFQNYHCVISPAYAIRILNSNKLSNNEFNAQKNFYTYNELDYDELISLINKVEIKTKPSSLLKNIEQETGIKPQNAKKYSEYLYNTSDEEEYLSGSLNDLNELFDILKELPIRSREFLYAILLRAGDVSGLSSQYTLTLCQDLVSFLNIGKQTFLDEFHVLERYNIVTEDEENEKQYVRLRQINKDYHILGQIKDFAKKHNLNLEDIIVNMNFKLFD